MAQAPNGLASDDGVALRGSPSGRRLVRMCGLLDFDQLLDHLEPVNLLERDPGNRWPLLEARDRALQMYWLHHMRDRRVVLLGRAVQDAFGAANPAVSSLKPFQWVRANGTWWATSPHPSGLSRAWNDHAVRRGGDTFWRAVVG